ncbi:MAG: hypothetical protein E6G56_12060 [Actinobacteria bacterium]|nr:MAG: hypothetical protein E6G56_12060 [Actinomycetota bacterium]
MTGIAPGLARASDGPRHPAQTAARDQVKKLSPVQFTQFPTDKCAQPCKDTLVPWQGRYVAVLVDPSVPRDPRVMQKMVSAFDRAWQYYRTTTGGTPKPVYSLHGRDEVAEVPAGTTCGAGCTYPGETGTEFDAHYFEDAYQQLAQHGLHSQIAFYEFGRSFWFWDRQLKFHAPDQDPVVTGFAVWMRFRSMDAAGVPGAPFKMGSISDPGTPFETFRAQVVALAGEYEASSQTFAQTLAMNRSPGMYGGTDFWASLMMQVAQAEGDQNFVSRFWHHAGSLPKARSTTQAVTNWIKDINYAGCVNLNIFFYDELGFPMPDGTTMPRRRASPLAPGRGCHPVVRPGCRTGRKVSRRRCPGACTSARRRPARRRRPAGRRCPVASR